MHPENRKAPPAAPGAAAPLTVPVDAQQPGNRRSTSHTEGTPPSHPALGREPERSAPTRLLAGRSTRTEPSVGTRQASARHRHSPARRKGLARDGQAHTHPGSTPATAPRNRKASGIQDTPEADADGFPHIFDDADTPHAALKDDSTLSLTQLGRNTPAQGERTHRQGPTPTGRQQHPRQRERDTMRVEVGTTCSDAPPRTETPWRSRASTPDGTAHPQTNGDRKPSSQRQPGCPDDAPASTERTYRGSDPSASDRRRTRCTGERKWRHAAQCSGRREHPGEAEHQGHRQSRSGHHAPPRAGSRKRQLLQHDHQDDVPGGGRMRQRRHPRARRRPTNGGRLHARPAVRPPPEVPPRARKPILDVPVGRHRVQDTPRSRVDSDGTADTVRAGLDAPRVGRPNVDWQTHLVQRSDAPPGVRGSTAQRQRATS